MGRAIMVMRSATHPYLWTSLGNGMSHVRSQRTCIADTAVRWESSVGSSTLRKSSESKRKYSDSALYPMLIEGTRLNAGFVVSLAAVAVGYILLDRSFVGYQMRVGGLADAAARYAGFKSRRMVWLGMLIGGGAAGIAGMGEVAGPIGQLQPLVSPGYGFAAIIVAFVGRLHPVGILFASLLMSLLYLGGEAAQMKLALPSSVTGLFQGTLLLFLLAADVFIHYRLRIVRMPAAVARTA